MGGSCATNGFPHSARGRPVEKGTIPSGRKHIPTFVGVKKRYEMQCAFLLTSLQEPMTIVTRPPTITQAGREDCSKRVMEPRFVVRPSRASVSRTLGDLGASTGVLLNRPG
jgi:hypothetical protein